jgi:alpha-beta hydrolase superfamily lysophospholipase
MSVPFLPLYARLRPAQFFFLLASSLTINGATPCLATAQAGTERGAFVLVQKDDTVAIERFARSADSLAVDLAMKMQGRFVYTATLAKDFSIPRMILLYYRPNVSADVPPAQTAIITVKGDSVIAEVSAGGNTSVQRLKGAIGAVLSPPSSFAAFEELTMRARSAGGAAEVPIFTTAGGVNLIVSLKPVGSDSMTASLAGQQYRLRIDEVGHILGGSMAAAGLIFTRVDAATAAKIALGKPDYSAPPDAPYSSEEVTLRGPNGIRLGGTLTKPKNVIGPLPAVVTITGSGQQDRDEYIPVAGGYRPFRQLADTLGRRGIAVLRLDDRGVGSSGGEPATSTTADFADDIRAGIAYLRTRADIDGSRLGLIGHSEGGIIAPMIAATDAKLKGIVLLAGPADNGLDIIRHQQRFALDHDTLLTPTKRDSAYNAQLIQLDSIARKNAWIKFFLSYDPISTAKKVKTPVLVLQGKTDRQVSFEQAEKLGAAIRAGGNRDVTVHVFPGENHLFIADVDGNPAAYGKLATNKMASDVLGTIADWLVVRLKASAKPSPDHPI